MANFPTLPYSTADLMDLIEPKLTELSGFGVKRFDQYDMMGSGHGLPSEMADPKWIGKFIFHTLTNIEERLISTRMRKLQGSINKFYIYDPRRKYPLYDPLGTLLGSNVVQIKSIGSGNNEIELKGLPVSFEINIGDRAQIAYGADSNYYFEFGNARTADGSGNTTMLEVFPTIPVGVVGNDILVLKKPACKVALVQNGFLSGNSFNSLTDGVTIEFLEQV